MATEGSSFLSPDMLLQFVNRIVDDTRREVAVIEKRIADNQDKGKLAPKLVPEGMAKDNQNFLRFCIEWDERLVETKRMQAIEQTNQYIRLLPIEHQQSVRVKTFARIYEAGHDLVHEPEKVVSAPFQAHSQNKDLSKTFEAAKDEMPSSKFINPKVEEREGSRHLQDIVTEFESRVTEERIGKESARRDHFNDKARDDR